MWSIIVLLLKKSWTTGGVFGRISPPRMQPQPARLKAFGTAELLEAILLRLDMHTLLVSAQRVSKHWHVVVSDSPTLQQKLFFRAEKDDTKREPRENILLAAAFQFCFFHLKLGELQQLPLIMKTTVGAHSVCWGGGCTCFSWFRQTRARRKAFGRKEASWRRMLIQQPPIRNWHLVYSTWMGGLFHCSPSGKEPPRMQDLITLLFLPRLPSGLHKAAFSGFRVVWRRSRSLRLGPPDYIKGAVTERAPDWELVVHHCVTKMTYSQHPGYEVVYEILMGKGEIRKEVLELIPEKITDEAWPIWDADSPGQW